MRNLLFAAAATVLALMGMASCSSKPSVDYPEAMLIDTAAYHTVFNAFVNGDEETLREFIGGDDHSKCRDVEYSSEEWKRTADSHGGVERYELVDEHSRISHPDAVQDRVHTFGYSSISRTAASRKFSSS